MTFVTPNDTPELNALKALFGAPISMGRGENPVELLPAATCLPKSYYKENKMKVAIYCRVDTPTNEVSNEILRAQRESLERYAKVKGFEIVDSYLEIGTGTDQSRPQLRRLIQDYEAGKIDFVLTVSDSRLFRGRIPPKELMQILEVNICPDKQRDYYR